VDRLSIIESESRRLAEVLADADPDSRCPTCPDWNAADLLWHLTEVHYFWAGILERDVTSGADLPEVEAAKPERPAALADVLPLREQATASLLSGLASRDDAAPLWSWWEPDQTVGFTRRMQTYEATMHRVDAELTAGLPISPIAEDVAAGAIDHSVDVMWGWKPEGATYEATAVVEFVASDTGQRWLVEVGSWASPDGENSGPMATRPTAGEPTATVTAPIVDLALWAWTRGAEAQISGRPESVAAVNAVVTQGMP
jgi:uncharacterized protein (TIGR03083 family)